MYLYVVAMYDMARKARDPAVLALHIKRLAYDRPLLYEAFPNFMLLVGLAGRPQVASPLSPLQPLIVASSGPPLVALPEKLRGVHRAKPPRPTQ